MKLRAGRVQFSFPSSQDDQVNQKEVDRSCAIFGLLKFIPCKAAFSVGGEMIEAGGISPLFDECQEGTKPPLYEIIVHTVEGKVDSIEAKKIEG